MGTRYKGPAAVRIALDGFIKLSRAMESLTAWLAGESPFSPGLTAGRFGTLEALLHCGPMSQQEICGKLLKSKGNTTLVVDNLEREGLVKRGGVGADRRKRMVSLTPKGRELITGYFPDHARAITKAMSVLAREEQLELGRLCRKLGLSLSGRGTEIDSRRIS
jgi:MarR family 2-MHQ and catechol resistance regulon transcriptional repressor